MNFKKYFKNGKHIILFCTILIACASNSDLFSQNNTVKPSRQSSLEAFSKGNYELAYNEFSELLITYSKDPSYKYYSGVCLVKLQRNPSEAESLLKKALQSAAVVKTLPSDAFFYLGRSQQMSGKFAEASGSFNSFIEQAGKKTAREYAVSDFIQQCSEKRGKISESNVAEAVILKSEAREMPVPENKPAVKVPVQIPQENRNSGAVSSVPQVFDKILDEALELQIKADSLNGLVALQEKQLEKLSSSERNALKTKIAETELAAQTFQKAADEKYHQAQLAINPKEDLTQNISPQPVRKEAVKDSVKKEVIKSVNPVTELPSKTVVNVPDKQDNTIKIAVPAINKTVEVFSIFEILPKPVKDPVAKISIDSEVPAGLIYRIQVAVFRNPVAPDYFKGITPVYGFKLAGTDRTNYYAGMFRRYADASKALGLVKTKGFKDAFIVSLLANKPVSSDRAAVLEKEWGKKPLNIISVAPPQNSVDTIPPSLEFRVEVVRSQKPLKDDVIDDIKKLAGTRGFDIVTIDDGKIVYLIGKFITFVSAAEYADLLVRNGYREAKVGAWLGKKEIPVETAKQLFDELK